MKTYICSFDRIGRSRRVPDLSVETEQADEIAFNVVTYARQFLESSEVEVTVELDKGIGRIFAGWRDAGIFRIEEQEVENAVE